MFKGLEGKSAIVTGGATLIGAGVVRALHAAGVKVVIADIDCRQRPGAGGFARRRPCAFVRNRHHRRRTGAGLRGGGGRAARAACTSLVNLACSYVDDGFKSPRADWLTSFNVNVASAVAMLQAVHPHMVSAGGGAVVNFTSISSRVAQTGRWLYPVSKAAMAQLTRNMAMDLAPDRIRVNSVSPGWTWSAVMDRLSGGDRAKTDRVAAPLSSARARRRPGRSGAGGAVPVFGPCQFS